ncbi:MAG: hypothetical protein WC663_02495 [Patescibacteria group bacterium]|jgi:hypothetical protein
MGSKTPIQEMRQKLALYNKLAKKIGHLGISDLTGNELEFTVLCLDGYIRKIEKFSSDGVVYIVLRKKDAQLNCKEKTDASPGTTGIIIQTVTLEKWNEITCNGKFLGTSKTGHDYDKDDYVYALYVDPNPWEDVFGR